MASTTLSIPEIHCGHCKSAIESAVGPVDGVTSVRVDVDTALVHLEHADDLSLRAVVDAIEDQGYDVPAQDALAGS